MAKVKSVFFCQNCGAESAKWMGKCSACGEWNTFVEEKISKKSKSDIIPNKPHAEPIKLSAIQYTKEERINTNIGELDRILGGGIVPGTVILLGGEPGIGKSTLALQLALKKSNKKVLYVSGEESQWQIKLRADRIIKQNSNDCFILSETSLENVFNQIERNNPDIIIIDSIQTLQTDTIESSSGSVSQIRECAAKLQQLAKIKSLPIILIGHITKDGSIAGPKILEHIVDTVLYFEGDQNYQYRILRAIKNRFGATSELGIFEMRGDGLIEITNPSEILIGQSKNNLSGSAISATIDGMRPFLIEIQALVSTAAYGNPQRSTTGFDVRRLNMLLAVLEKRAGFNLISKDVFINIAGGIKVSDPAIDLAVVCAILSSGADKSIDKKICFAGEVGLSGEIRQVNKIEQRIKEAEKLGFKTVVASVNNNFQKNFNAKININNVNKINDLYNLLFR